MSREDLCNKLGIPLINNKSELKAIWRQLVLKYHPDRNKEPNADKNFAEMVKLFEELTKSFDIVPQDIGITITINGYNFGSTMSSTAATGSTYWSY